MPLRGKKLNFGKGVEKGKRRRRRRYKDTEKLRGRGGKKRERESGESHALCNPCSLCIVLFPPGTKERKRKEEEKKVSSWKKKRGGCFATLSWNKIQDAAPEKKVLLEVEGGGGKSASWRRGSQLVGHVIVLKG